MKNSSQELPRLSRLGIWILPAGAIAMFAAGCGVEAKDAGETDGTQTGHITYYDNGSRTYAVNLPLDVGGSGNAQVFERCTDYRTIEAVYYDGSGRLASTTNVLAPEICADGRITPQDFIATTPTSGN